MIDKFRGQIIDNHDLNHERTTREVMLISQEERMSKGTHAACKREYNQTLQIERCDGIMCVRGIMLCDPFLVTATELKNDV